MAVEIPLKMEIALYVGDLKCRLASVDAWKRIAIDPEYETALHFAEMALISVENLEDEKARAQLEIAKTYLHWALLKEHRMEELKETFSKALTSPEDLRERREPVYAGGYPIVGHGAWGGVECRGALVPVVHENQAAITCNMCGAVVKTVLVADVDAALLEMALADCLCSAVCVHCGITNTFKGITSVDAFYCSECGRLVAPERPSAAK